MPDLEQGFLNAYDELDRLKSHEKQNVHLLYVLNSVLYCEQLDSR